MSYVYFVEAVGTGLVKIGLSADPMKRVGSLRIACPVDIVVRAIVPGDRDLERSLHRRFAQHWARGEWFRMTPDIVSFMDQTEAPIVVARTFPMRDRNVNYYPEDFRRLCEFVVRVRSMTQSDVAEALGMEVSEWPISVFGGALLALRFFGEMMPSRFADPEWKNPRPRALGCQPGGCGLLHVVRLNGAVVARASAAVRGFGLRVPAAVTDELQEYHACMLHRSIARIHMLGIASLWADAALRGVVDPEDRKSEFDTMGMFDSLAERDA